MPLRSRRRQTVGRRSSVRAPKGSSAGTGGVADDGTAIQVVRFESQEAAEANSARPEQGAWWDETSKLFDGDVDVPQLHEDQLIRAEAPTTPGSFRS